MNIKNMAKTKEGRGLGGWSVKLCKGVNYVQVGLTIYS